MLSKGIFSLSHWIRKPVVRMTVMCLAVSLVAVFLAGPSVAQDPDPAPAVVAPVDTAAAAKNGGNLFTHILESAGIFFGPLLGGISIGLVALVVYLLMELRMETAVPKGFIDQFTDLVNKRQLVDAKNLAQNDPSFLGQTLFSGMSHLQYGLDNGREFARGKLDEIRASKESSISYLSVIGQLGPLLGLVGTVYGMILAFMTLKSSTKVEPARLAGDISHALVVTLLGVGVSVPAIFFFTFFSKRLVRICIEVGQTSDDLLTQLHHGARRAPQAGSAPTVAMAVPIPQNPPTR
ncbi:MAG: MotA/TolQ/ExbB proton channel family protein [Gemmataceae bacterium]|nr:MotA/TolQ/ExbB proton channel family protein [Gemmataceae bacterium]